MTTEYRVSEGVLLRNENYLLRAFVGGQWKWYDGIVTDWYDKSSPIEPGEVARLLEAISQPLPTQPGPPKEA